MISLLSILKTITEAERTKSGIKVKKAYLTKNKAAMKRNIEEIVVDSLCVTSKFLKNATPKSVEKFYSFQEFINESMKLLDKFDEDENETLSVLMHDKAHILGKAHVNNSTLDSIFGKVKGAYYNAPLWRGVYKGEKDFYEQLYISGETGITTRYLSFSESKEAAIRFSALSARTNVLIKLIEGKGLLNYHQWIREMAAQGLEMGGDAIYYRDIIELADKELEHIMNIGTRIRVIDKRQKDNLTIYIIKQS